jgi:hypothetical protein
MLGVTSDAQLGQQKDGGQGGPNRLTPQERQTRKDERRAERQQRREEAQKSQFKDPANKERYLKWLDSQDELDETGEFSVKQGESRKVGELEFVGDNEGGSVNFRGVKMKGRRGIVLPDGRKLKKGEVITLPDGTSVGQQ